MVTIRFIFLSAECFRLVGRRSRQFGQGCLCQIPNNSITQSYHGAWKQPLLKKRRSGVEERRGSLGRGIAPSPPLSNRTCRFAASGTARGKVKNSFSASPRLLLLAKSRHPVVRNRLPLDPRQRTFRGLRWTSGFDPGCVKTIFLRPRRNIES